MLKFGKVWMIVVLLLVSMPFILPTQQAVACSCMFPETAQEAKNEAAATFTGTVTQIGEDSPKQYENYDVATLSVKQSWSGVSEPEVEVYTSWSSCQFDFEKGKTYLLYPYEHDGRYEVTNCGRSGEVIETNARVMDDLQQLGAGTVFEQSAQEIPSAESSRNRWILPVTLGVSALLVIAAGGWMLLRKRSQ
ncbi:hypothetical protein [Saccharibacillus sp. JS10]|uniref:hypothetical protein n=1 Tax=Saccharibacillus sp. JS10 TaxID=2950552 RepID=UPI00210D25E6|nr:hypothetical protein [Saccharibacillus sp. JS10]MCQ4088371.1 hypothetical protein [Saccharibacillus sp. JS10]